MRRRGRPPGSGTKVARSTYERATKFVSKLCFWIPAYYTKYREFKLSDEEWETFAEPATNLAQKYIPLKYASGINDLSDVGLLAEALMELIDVKREGYRLAKLEADRRAEEYQERRNGFGQHSEVPIADILAGT